MERFDICECVWVFSLQRFHICYWMSVSMQRGFELNCGRLTLSSQHALRLVPIRDGLVHRPKTDWSVVFLNCELQVPKKREKNVSTLTSGAPLPLSLLLSRHWLELE